MGSSVGTLQIMSTDDDLKRRFKKEQFLPEVLSMVNFDVICDLNQTVSIDELIKALSEKTDVFMSHNQGTNMDNHNLIAVISAGLKSRGIITFCDSRLIFHEGVMIDNARCVAVFITENYESKITGVNDFDSCKLEFRHAVQTKTPAFMIPAVMEVGMCNSGVWKDQLKTMLGPSQNIIDMSNHPDHAHLETKIDELYKAIVTTVKIPLLALLEKQCTLLGCTYSGSIITTTPTSPTHMIPTVLWNDVAKNPVVTTLNGECVMTLTGHSDAVVGLVQLTDGRLCSCSEDCSIMLWDLSTEGTNVMTLTGHTGIVHCVIHLTGLLLCSCSDDWLIKVWDLRTGTCVRTLTGHTGGVWSIIQMSDLRLCSGSADHSIMIWNMGTDTCDAVLNGHSGPVFCVIQLVDDRLCSCSMDKTIMIWDVRTGTCVMTLTGHQQFVRTVVQLSDGRLCSGSLDKSIMIWDLISGSCIMTLNGHTELVKSVIELSDGRICSGSWDNSMMIWDLINSSCVMTLTGHTRAVRTVIQLSDGRICSGSADNSMKVWM